MTNTRITSLPVVRGGALCWHTTASSRGLERLRSNIGEIASAAAHESVSRSRHSGELDIISITNHSYARLLYVPRPWASSQLDRPSVHCAQVRLHLQTPQAFARTLSRA